ncbi:hypothetical protein ACFY9F_36690 [Streptomyces sp. NPDC012421]|uniref:hypothetical protein n=1 Tax=Streptomyces sp. NPDC012421 TaxID=3364832 RepID=UPI0036EB3174
MTVDTKEFRDEVGLPAQPSRNELDALQECIDSLSELDEAARRRVLRYLNDRFDARADIA